LVVLWTATSVKSDWVSNEAAEGARRRILIPALLDEVEIPFEFKRIQAANLIDWRGESDHAGFQQLIKALTDLLGPPDAKVLALEASETTLTESIPDEKLPDDDRRPDSEPSAPQPAITKPRGRGSTARIGGLVALFVMIALGVAVFINKELFQPRRAPLEDSATKPGIEIAEHSVKPEPADARPSVTKEAIGEAPSVEKEVSASSIKPEPEKPAQASSEEPKSEPPTYATESSPPKARTEPPKTIPPIVKEPKLEAPTRDLKTPPPLAKPHLQKPPRPTVRELAPAQPTPDYKTWAAQVKPEEPTAAAKPREASSHKKIANSIGMEFVLIPASAAAFTMGSRIGIEELIRRFGGTEVLYKSEKPFRSVKIERPFYLLRTPVTQGQWQRVMGDNPSSFKECGEDCPVEMVSWEDAQRFISRLNQMEGTAGYRLPSEAEWEYAARAGNESEFFFSDDAGRLGEFAWYSANSGNKTHAVSQKKSNAWSLYDMAGNAWEWVEDDWHATYDGAPIDGSAAWIDKKRGTSRVVRGGGWGVLARYCRSSARYYGNATARTSHVGFRLVKSFGPGP
jgi:formylglycine-generating enzyme required for sulfatase activity